MTTERKPRSDRTATPTGRTYTSVAEMLAAEGTERAVQEQFAAAQESTRITRALAQLRTSAGLTQTEMGKRIGLSQGAVSKLESGRDDDLTLSEVRAYSEQLNARIGLCFGPPPTHAEAIKLHAHGMRHSMLELAKLARADAQMEHAVQKFFGDAFFNLLEIMDACQKSLPNGVSGFTVRMEVHPTVVERTPPPGGPSHGPAHQETSAAAGRV